MNSLTDQQLLIDYTECRSETAFTELVRRHIDFVYSAALRMVRNTHLAEDVTQSVFVAAAQSARQLVDCPVLPGWLHRTTQNLAANAVRSDVRRRAREQEAAVMNELLSANPDASWEHIAPYLDDALGELIEPDRDAVLLRYFKNHDLRTVGATLGISDDAAQKRVSRAVERLREFFAKRGVTVGAGGLAVVISANAVQAAPVGLALTISTSAALTGAITTATIATHTTMNWITAKTVGTIVAAALAAGTGTYLVQQRESNRLRNENQNLATVNMTLSSERDAVLSTATASQNEIERLRKEKGELLRLRGEVGLLRKQASEMANIEAENLRLRTASASLQSSQPIQTPTTAQTKFPRETWAFAGYATPESAMHTWIWAVDKGDKKAMLDSLIPEEQTQWKKMLESQSMSKSPFNAYSFATSEMISDEEATMTVVSDFPDGRHTGDQKMRLKKIGNDWKIAGQAKE